MDFSALNIVIATLFVVMVCGFVCRKTGIIDDTASKKLSLLILKIGQPAMIISALSSAKYSEENLKIAGIIIILGFALHLTLAILAYFACLPYKKVADEQKISEFSMVFANTAFIGFPIFQALFGDIGLFMASFLVISFNVLMWTLGLSIFARGRDDIKLTPKKALLNFGTIPCVIGFALYLLKHPAVGFEMPAFAASSLQYLTNLCTPISLLITGALIATQKPKKIFCTWKLFYFNIVRLIILPIAICLICKLLNIPQIYALFATAGAALPAASSVSMMAEAYGLDSGYSSLTVGTSSLISVVSLPIILRFAQWLLVL